MRRVLIHHPALGIEREKPVRAVPAYLAAGWQTGPLPSADEIPSPDVETAPDVPAGDEPPEEGDEQ